MIKTNSREKAGDDSDESIYVPPEIQLPPTGVDYLVGHFFSSGQCLQTGQGLVPLSYQEIKAYDELTDAELLTWEVRILKKMSDAYCSEYSRASDPNRPAPYRKEVNPEEVDQVAKAIRIKQGMSGFRKRKG